MPLKLPLIFDKDSKESVWGEKGLICRLARVVKGLQECCHRDRRTRTFYENGGISFTVVFIPSNYPDSRSLGWGSTITQQLAKMLSVSGPDHRAEGPKEFSWLWKSVNTASRKSDHVPQ